MQLPYLHSFIYFATESRVHGGQEVCSGDVFVRCVTENETITEPFFKASRKHKQPKTDCVLIGVVTLMCSFIFRRCMSATVTTHKGSAKL